LFSHDEIEISASFLTRYDSIFTVNEVSGYGMKLTIKKIKDEQTIETHLGLDDLERFIRVLESAREYIKENE